LRAESSGELQVQSAESSHETSESAGSNP
jgi:hypothetical protein